MITVIIINDREKKINVKRAGESVLACIWIYVLFDSMLAVGMEEWIYSLSNLGCWTSLSGNTTKIQW